MAWHTVRDGSPVDRTLMLVDSLLRGAPWREERVRLDPVAVDGMHELTYAGRGLYYDHDRTMGLRTRDIGRFKTEREAIEAWRGMLRRGEL